MKTLIIAVALFTFCTGISHLRKVKNTAASQDDEDAHLSVTQLISKYGYPVEEHFVNTPDGYILRLHRIPHGKNSDTGCGKIVFLMHGILSSSADWITTGTTHGLGYLLADAGYDVWMGNARGNHESRNHTTLNPDTNADFWHFSWHQIGAIDLPTMIDYALEFTGQSQLFHIGHSQGTTTFYVMTSIHPEYNGKVKAHFSLAPIAFMDHMTSILMHALAFWSGGLDLLAQLIGINEFLPSNDFMALICEDQALCTNALFAICGFSPDEMNATMLPVLMGHTPAGCSVMQMMHYAQEVNSGAFRQYDYGLHNLNYYGTLTPPPRNDWLSAGEDVVRLCEGIGAGCKAMTLVADGHFNHLDYMFGIRAPELVYEPIMSLMAEL